MRACQANPARLPRFFPTERTGPPVLPFPLPQIDARLAQVEARLLILDPWVAHLDADAIKDQQVRKALHPFKMMLRQRRCAGAGLRHLNKGGGTKAWYRGGGSIAIIGAARAGLLVAADPENPNHRVGSPNQAQLSPGAEVAPLLPGMGGIPPGVPGRLAPGRMPVQG
jgi:hypothetical protein